MTNEQKLAIELIFKELVKIKRVLDQRVIESEDFHYEVLDRCDFVSGLRKANKDAVDQIDRVSFPESTLKVEVATSPVEKYSVPDGVKVCESHVQACSAIGIPSE